MLLGHIADHPEEKYSLAELTEFLGLDKSSVFRLLSTLMQSGLIRQTEGKKTYQLGFGIYKLAGALHDQLKITEAVAPFLRNLALTTKENAHLAVRSGTQAIFIDREKATKTIATNTNIGDSEELYCTAVGRCLICEMSDADIVNLFADTKLTRYTDRTIVDLAELSRELVKVRDQGFAVDREEYEPKVVCIAAPIYNFEGGVEAAIGISGPKERVDSQLEAYTSAVRTAGLELSALLGRAPKKAKNT